MNRKTKLKVFKLTMLILAIVVLTLVTIYLFPVIRNLATKEGQLEFKQKVTTSGVWGVIMLFSIQIAQIFLFILPGEPIEILAGMCYGSIWGTIFIMLSSAIISGIIFALVKKLGKQFIYDFCDEEKVKKFENNKLFQNPKKIELILFIVFVIPGTPKDLLTYVSGLFPISMWRFILISTVARFPSIITSTLAGAHIATGNWKLGIAMYGIIVIVVFIAIYIFNKFDKENTAKKIMENMK